MFLRKPIGSIREIVDLRLRVTLCHARNRLRPGFLRRKISVLRRECPRQIFSGLLLRLNGERERKTNKTTHPIFFTSNLQDV